MLFITNHAEYPATYLRNEITKQTHPYHGWVAGERERVRQLVQESIDQLIDCLISGGFLNGSDRHKFKAVKAAYRQFLAAPL